MYRTILLAVDGSHASRLATFEAAALARAMAATVHAVYVLDGREPLLEVAYLDRDALWRSMAEFGRGVLRATGDQLGAAGVAHTLALVEHCVAPGQVARTLVARAKACHADLIAMGTHGRRGLRRAVMGSVARAVLREWAGPMLLTRSNADD